ncbi:MAG: rod shape-determining protein MreD [Alistipes sp.]
MYKIRTYLLLFVVLMLLQTFLFNNLTISVYLNPLVYIAFVALLPLDTPRGWLLLAGLVVGLVADWTMAAAGINTISTVLIAFLRPTILDMLFGKENIRDGGTPSVERFGAGSFLQYLMIVVLLHHLVFFALEALSWSHLLTTLLRLVMSGAVTIACTWIASKLTTSKLSARL